MKKSSQTLPQKPKYIETLLVDARKRYNEKISWIGGVDPMELPKKDLDDSVDRFPPTCSTDIFNYVVLGTSAYTLEQFKNFRSLEAYRFFVAGFVSDVGSFTPNNSLNNQKLTVVTAKVKHSQRMSDPLLRTWIILEESGAVKSAHCTCIAGLGETCSHVGATLFWIDYAVQLRGKKTVTEEKAYWKVPSTTKITYEPITNINFQSAKCKKKTAEAMLTGQTPPANRFRPARLSAADSQPPALSEISDFADKLIKAGQRPAFTTSLPQYKELYRPPPIKDKTPASLRSLRDVKTGSLNYGQLLEHCKGKVLPNIKVMEEEAVYAEAETRGQSDSKLWYSLRAGRVTASRFHEIVHTNPASPALSLVKSICYPEEAVFTSTQTSWGLENEARAQEEYLSKVENEHTDFKFFPSGLVLSTEHPFLGASPDGFVSCSCHVEKGCIEIKCPYKHATSLSISEACSDKDFCLEIKDQQPTLKKCHKYYSQIQCQLHVTKSDFCDFIVYLPAETYVERILPDNEFWKVYLPIAAQVFETALLPELVGHFFTKSENASTSAVRVPLSPKKLPGNAPKSESKDDSQWCYCKESKNAQLIACDNENCLIKWFHFPCVGVKSNPKGSWFCPDCRKVKRAGGKRKKQAKC